MYVSLTNRWSGPRDDRGEDEDQERPPTEPGDERRFYYRITTAGLRVARAEARRLEARTRAARVGGLLGKAAK